MSPGGTPHNSEESQSNINCEMLVGNLRELSIYPAIAQKSSFIYSCPTPPSFSFLLLSSPALSSYLLISTLLTKSISAGGTPITPNKINKILTVRCLLETSENYLSIPLLHRSLALCVWQL